MSTRGVTPADQPPLYCEIDEAAYQTYLPSNTVRDIESAVTALLADEPACRGAGLSSGLE